MKCKKIITVIIATLLILLPMMTTPVQAAVGKVYGLSANASGRGINFTWEKVTGADGYNLYINTENKGYELIGSVNGTKATVVGFTTNKVYKARVCAYELKNGQKIEGTLSQEIAVNYNETEKNTALSKITGLNATQSGEYINLTWNEISNATGYLIYANMPGFGYMNLGHVFSNNIFIKGGVAGKAYEFKVCAYKNTNSGTVYGELSNSKSITVNNTKNEELKLAKPTGIYVSNITKNKAFVEWDKVNNATGYEVYLAKENGSYSCITTTTRTYTEISGLNSDTNYKVIIVAYNDEQNKTVYSQDSSARSFRTDEDTTTIEKVGQVKRVQVSRVYTDGAYITWDEAQNATNYDIYLAKENGIYKYVKNTTRTYAEISGLDSDTTYRVIIAPNDNRGNAGTDSSAVSFTTQRDEIKGISGFNVEVKHRNEAYLQWWEDDNADGYEVWAAKNGETFKKIDDVNESTYILYNLEYNTGYKVKVRAFEYRNGSKNYGDFSTIKYFTTEKYNRYEYSQNVGNVNNVTYYVVKDTVYLNWNKVSDADGYEIEFTVPGIGGTINMRTTTNSREISGLTEKDYKYTARVRAYRIVNGIYEYGQYSKIQKFSAK